MSQYAKAIVPGIVTIALLVLEQIGVTPDMTVEQAVTVAVTGAITAAGVYWVRNT